MAPKRPVKKACQIKSVNDNSVGVDKSKKYLNTSNTTPSTNNTFCPQTKEYLEVSSPNTVLDSVSSSQSLVSEEIEIHSNDEKSSIKENLSAEIQNDSQPKTEDSANKNYPVLLQYDSHKENCVIESENSSSESITKIGFHKSGHKKRLMNKKVAKPYKCGRCKFKCSTPKELESHNLEMKNKKDYYCEICDFNFHLKNLINQHKSNHSPTNLMRQCNLCHQPIYDRLHLRYHMYTIHRGEPAHECSYCSRTFMWKRELTKHLHKFHEVKPTFVCEICKKVYADKVKYMKHIEYFHRKSYCCKICLKSFKNIDRLCLHEKNHTKITTYKCQYCFKKYRKPENLKLHEEQHKGNFEYRCDTCDLGFQELTWFESHKAKKTCVRTRYDYTIRPTMCEICGKMFANRVTFKNHHLLHFDPHPYECNICFKKLRYKQKLVYHKRRYHPESSPSTSGRPNKSV